MNKIIFLATFVVAFATSLGAQEVKQSKIGWFITPEVGALFLENSVGKTVGASFGLTFFKNRLKVGIMGYGRPGPLNSAVFSVTPYQNQTYKGQTKLNLRSDWGLIGGFIAPNFKIKKIEIDVPIAFGTGIGGFYLHGDDRKTPDGERVSVWEDKLFNGEDASAGGWTEFGVRTFFPTKINGLKWGAGVFYTRISGWKTFADPLGETYNNKFRASIFLNFGSYR